MSWLHGPPGPDVEPPAAVRRLARGAPLRGVWATRQGGLTFAVGGDAGRFVGHVDLGSLGVADRWADLAVAAMSLGWNFGPGWESVLHEAYGIDPDPVRIAYHQLLWDRC